MPVVATKDPNPPLKSTCFHCVTSTATCGDNNAIHASIGSFALLFWSSSGVSWISAACCRSIDAATVAFQLLVYAVFDVHGPEEEHQRQPEAESEFRSVDPLFQPQRALLLRARAVLGLGFGLGFVSARGLVPGRDFTSAIRLARRHLRVCCGSEVGSDVSARV
eukprot:31173-Pelagococcus_subviridis.AAC.1